MSKIKKQCDIPHVCYTILHVTLLVYDVNILCIMVVPHAYGKANGTENNSVNRNPFFLIWNMIRYVRVY